MRFGYLLHMQGSDAHANSVKYEYPLPKYITEV